MSGRVCRYGREECEKDKRVYSESTERRFRI
jgi:hypothetical protein